MMKTRIELHNEGVVEAVSRLQRAKFSAMQGSTALPGEYALRRIFPDQLAFAEVPEARFDLIVNVKGKTHPVKVVTTKNKHFSNLAYRCYSYVIDSGQPGLIVLYGGTKESFVDSMESALFAIKQLGGDVLTMGEFEQYLKTGEVKNDEI